MKYEEVYLQEYETPADSINRLASFFTFYSNERPHESLAGQTHLSVHQGKVVA